ncbi:MAG: phosphoribosylaminoimidazolesuccinocarboxamide synthase [Patescibacteria group bacterium]
MPEENTVILQTLKSFQPNELPRGRCIATGKTKLIIDLEESPGNVAVFSMDNVTAGNGRRKAVGEGKGVLSNEISSNVFARLKRDGIPVAFVRKGGDRWFEAPACRMLPFELVVRRRGTGSFTKRNPIVADGAYFEQLVSETYLKTTGKRWGEHELPDDDPLMVIDEKKKVIHLHDASVVFDEGKPFLTLPFSAVFTDPEDFERLGTAQRQSILTFIALEAAWREQECDLWDFKVEAGVTAKGEVIIADVIDAESCRVRDKKGVDLSKQFFRDGGDIDKVVARYRMAAEYTKRFNN